jgi:hypothetical protein
LLVIRCDTSICPKVLKDGPDLLDPDIRVFTCCQSDAMSKLIVFVDSSEVGNAIPLVKIRPHCHAQEGSSGSLISTWLS